LSDTSDLQKQRQQKLEKLLGRGENPFKARFHRTHLLSQIIKKYKGKLEPGSATDEHVRVAGRLIAKREHGKASFAVLKDGSASLQLYFTLNDLGEEKYQFFLDLDIGDIIGISGTIFKTRRGELSIEVNEFSLLTKSLRPLPEKWHGLKDIETRYRQRYVDLIMNPEVQETFLIRNKVIQTIRDFLGNRDFVEVDTPMLHPIPGGATARPFITHHHALGMDLYLRIAPELYLKRLIVGGMDRVFELNRSFRNEGISVRHNPEFTMVEIYQAYADYNDMMELTEEMVKEVVKRTTGSLEINYQGEVLNFSSPWQKYTMLEAINKFTGLEVSFQQSVEKLEEIARANGVPLTPPLNKGKVIDEIFEKLVESQLVQPTFIKDYPVEISPLAKGHPESPHLTERFELIIAGREIANAFTELTDPREQRERLEEQLRLFGEEMGKVLDEDFLRALEYGMPPTGGLGIGVDRLVMLLTDAYSIRDVLFFPHLRPEK